MISNCTMRPQNKHSLLVDATGTVTFKLNDKEVLYFAFISFDRFIKTEPLKTESLIKSPCENLKVSVESNTNDGLDIDLPSKEETYLQQSKRSVYKVCKNIMDEIKKSSRQNQEQQDSMVSITAKNNSNNKDNSNCTTTDTNDNNALYSPLFA